MTDQTPQTTTEPVESPVKRLLDFLTANDGASGVVIDCDDVKSIADEIRALTTPQPLAVGLDREAVADAMKRLAEDAENVAGLGAGMLGGERIAADIKTVLSAISQRVAPDLLEVAKAFIADVDASDLDDLDYGRGLANSGLIERFRSALALAAPAEGYVLVPVEPTREMWAAGGDAVIGYKQRHHDKVVEEIWSAMIAACLPAAPTGETGA